MAQILLVEDQKDVALFITDFLQSKGYQVIAVYTGKEALDILQVERFDLAIIDLLLPDMNGKELCAIIRHDNRMKDLPLIVSTGVGDSFTQEVSKKLGANEFLSKPYATESLLSAVKKCLEIGNK